MEMLKNRIEKNYDRLGRWTKRFDVEAYRLYDRDIPEIPYIIDIYAGHAVVYERGVAPEEVDPLKRQANQEAITQILMGVLSIPAAQIIFKTRGPQRGPDQYEKLADKKRYLHVREGEACFAVNLEDYLDTGLFLDHRPLRHRILKNAFGKRFLNLFSYTGSMSVMAALGGASTFSIDMNGNYQEWAKYNFELNHLDPREHTFLVSDVMTYLERNQRRTQRFDLIFCDPPTFSNSKKMQGSFDVQRDHEELILKTMGMLHPEGTLYFSCNKRAFKLSRNLIYQCQIRNITRETIPEDFHDPKTHHCFEIRFKQ